jgi:hypothetical protein
MLAVTWIVGKSICGNDATGRNGNAAIPMNATAAISSEVATGRRMNGSERFIAFNRLVKIARQLQLIAIYFDKECQAFHARRLPARSDGVTVRIR